MEFSAAKRNRRGDKENEEVSEECGKGEHEEEGNGEVLQAQRRQSQLLLEALARVCEVGHEDAGIGENQ